MYINIHKTSSCALHIYILKSYRTGLDVFIVSNKDGVYLFLIAFSNLEATLFELLGDFIVLVKNPSLSHGPTFSYLILDATTPVGASSRKSVVVQVTWRIQYDRQVHFLLWAQFITWMARLSLWWFLQCLKKIMHRFAQCLGIWKTFPNTVIRISPNHNDEITEAS